MNLYHGSNQSIRQLLHNGSREKTDFGQGFYLTANETQARRWSIRGKHPIVNCYDVAFEGLQVYTFSIDLEWLLFIIYNRGIGSFNRGQLKNKFSFLNNVDVIVGPTADDRMYNTLEEFFDGDISLERTLDLLNCMELSMQYLVKTKRGIKNTLYIKSYELLSEQITDTIKDNHTFMTSIREKVKIYQRKHYSQETYIEDVQKEVENGAE